AAWCRVAAASAPTCSPLCIPCCALFLFLGRVARGLGFVAGKRVRDGSFVQCRFKSIYGIIAFLSAVLASRPPTAVPTSSSTTTAAATTQSIAAIGCGASTSD
ncbi:hypothetical protein BGZ65_004782, partial [Modicella reniformis]